MRHALCIRVSEADSVAVNEGLLRRVRELQPSAHDRMQQSVAFDVIEGLLKVAGAPAHISQRAQEGAC